jgi:hypothetical protein
MKLPLTTAVLSAIVAGCGGSTAGTTAHDGNARHFVLRVDRTLDRQVEPATYRNTPPVDRWDVTFEGSHVTLSGIDRVERVEGEELETSTPSVRRFALRLFAGGELVIRGDDAELTVFGSGVPVISSELGKLVAH